MQVISKNKKAKSVILLILNTKFPFANPKFSPDGIFSTPSHHFRNSELKCGAGSNKNRVTFRSLITIVLLIFFFKLTVGAFTKRNVYINIKKSLFAALAVTKNDFFSRAIICSVLAHSYPFTCPIRVLFF